MTPTNVDEQSSNTYTVNLSASGVDTTGGTTLKYSLDLPNNFSTDSTGVTNFEVNEGSVDYQGSYDVDTTENTINITLNGDSGSTNDVVNVTFEITNVVSPDVSGDATLPAQFAVDNNNDGSWEDGYTTIEQITVGDAVTGGGKSGAPTLLSAIHYDNDTSSSVDSEVELAFSETMDISTVRDNIELTVDDTTISSSKYTVTQSGTGRVLVQFTDDEIRTGDLVVNVPDSVKDADEGNGVSNSGDHDVTFAPVGVKESNKKNAYKGGNVAIISGGVDESVDVEGPNSYYFEGSTGTNSQVFVLNTSTLDLGQYNVSIDGSTMSNTQVQVRDLGLGVSLDSQSVTTDENIEGTVEARSSNRDLTLELLDSSGSEVDGTSIDATLNGQGEYDFSFDVSSLDVDTGNYTVLVTDDYSGVDAESSTVTVTEAGGNDASFVDSVITEDRGDVFEFTVEIDSTDTATVSFGSQSDGVQSNATLVDDDDDGQVTAYLNTTALSDASAGNVYSLPSDSDDSIDSQDLGTNTTNLVDAGDYDFDVTPKGESDSTDIATVTLDERGTQAINTWTLPASTSVSDLEDVNDAVADGELTQTDEIANGDKIVYELETTGIEGLLGAQANEKVTSEFLGASVHSFRVTQTNAGANQDAWDLDLGTQNTTVIADGDNDTYYVVVKTGTGSSAVNLTDQSKGQNGKIPDDETLTANYTVFNNDRDYTNGLDDDEDETTETDHTVVEPEITVSEPYNVSNAAEQTVSGTTSLAPGTELRLRIRSTGDTSPSFLKTGSPVVQTDRTWSVTFDFSGQSVGDTYDIVVNDGSGGADEVTESGEVVEVVETPTTTAAPDTDTATPEPDTATPEPDTATPEPDTATPGSDTDTPTSTPTSTPGFGVVIALTALVAAALLAVRRD